MSGDFECFVTIGDQKHTIYLDKDMDNVIFNDVYKQLTKLEVKPDVSFDNYYFELVTNVKIIDKCFLMNKNNEFLYSFREPVFDFEDNCFQRLTSVEIPIKYLSRIRVLPINPNNDCNDFRDNQRVNKEKKGFKTKFNSDLFNPELFNEHTINEDYYNVSAEEMVSVPKPKRPNRSNASRLWSETNYNRGYDSEESQMSDHFFNNELNFNTNKRMKFRGYGDYGADGYEYPPAPMSRPYVRRSDIEPIPGPSFADPYEEQPPPYYRRRNDFYSDQFMDQTPEEFPNLGPYHTNQYQQFVPDNFFQGHPPNMGFRQEFYPQIEFDSNFGQNYPQNPNFFNRKPQKGLMRDRMRRDQQIGNKSNSRPDFIQNTGTLTKLRANGFTVENINNFEYYFCEFCEKKFRPVYNAFNHIKSEEHFKNSYEKNLDPLDKLLLVKPSKTGPEVSIVRRQQLRKISKADKQKFVRHGIRLKDGTGSHAYICIRCCTSIRSLSDSHKHYNKFFQMNESINYPQNYHSLNDDNSLPKIELRYRRILNALELIVEDNRTDEEIDQLITLRDEGVVLKELIDGSNQKYYSCLVCDQRFDKSEEAMVHIQCEEHLTNRSPKRYKGLNKAMLIDSIRSNQIEVVLARKQELEKIKFFTKELNLEHGIRLKDGIGPEAYYCVKCEQWFDSSNSVRLHIEEYERKQIHESTEESLIQSAKKQMKLLSKQEEPAEEPPEVVQIKEEIIEEVEDKPVEEQLTEVEQKSDENLKEVEEKTEEQTKQMDEKSEEQLKDLEVISINEDFEEQMDFTADEDKNGLSFEITDQMLAEEGIKSCESDGKDLKYYDSICDIYFTDNKQAAEHLNRSFHKNLKSGQYFKPTDKEFCVPTNRINEEEVWSSRVQILDKLSDEVKQKFAEEGIRLKDGIGREAFWCVLCNDPILSPNVESSSYSFINHINYNPKHVELLIGQNK